MRAVSLSSAREAECPNKGLARFPGARLYWTVSMHNVPAARLRDWLWRNFIPSRARTARRGNRHTEVENVTLFSLTVRHQRVVLTVTR